MASGKCDICDKRTRFGRRIRLQARTSNWARRAPKKNRQFRPNVQRKKIYLDGKWQRVNICTRCLRTQARKIEEHGVPYQVEKVAAE
jgi:large subunit ribosomal protein L28